MSWSRSARSQGCARRPPTLGTEERGRLDAILRLVTSEEFCKEPWDSVTVALGKFEQLGRRRAILHCHRTSLEEEDVFDVRLHKCQGAACRHRVCPKCTEAKRRQKRARRWRRSQTPSDGSRAPSPFRALKTSVQQAITMFQVTDKPKRKTKIDKPSCILYVYTGKRKRKVCFKLQKEFELFLDRSLDRIEKCMSPKKTSRPSAAGDSLSKNTNISEDSKMPSTVNFHEVKQQTSIHQRRKKKCRCRKTRIAKKVPIKKMTPVPVAKESQIKASSYKESKLVSMEEPEPTHPPELQEEIQSFEEPLKEEEPIVEEPMIEEEPIQEAPEEKHKESVRFKDEVKRVKEPKDPTQLRQVFDSMALKLRSRHVERQSQEEKIMNEDEEPEPERAKAEATTDPMKEYDPKDYKKITKPEGKVCSVGSCTRREPSREGLAKPGEEQPPLCLCDHPQIKVVDGEVVSQDVPDPQFFQLKRTNLDLLAEKIKLAKERAKEKEKEKKLRKKLNKGKDIKDKAKEEPKPLPKPEECKCHLVVKEEEKPKEPTPEVSDQEQPKEEHHHHHHHHHDKKSPHSKKKDKKHGSPTKKEKEYKTYHIQTPSVTEISQRGLIATPLEVNLSTAPDQRSQTEEECETILPQANTVKRPCELHSAQPTTLQDIGPYLPTIRSETGSPVTSRFGESSETESVFSDPPIYRNMTPIRCPYMTQSRLTSPFQSGFARDVEFRPNNSQYSTHSFSAGYQEQSTNALYILESNKAAGSTPYLYTSGSDEDSVQYVPQQYYPAYLHMDQGFRRIHNPRLQSDRTHFVHPTRSMSNSDVSFENLNSAPCLFSVNRHNRFRYEPYSTSCLPSERSEVSIIQCDGPKKLGERTVCYNLNTVRFRSPPRENNTNDNHSGSATSHGSDDATLCYKSTNIRSDKTKKICGDKFLPFYTLKKEGNKSEADSQESSDTTRSEVTVAHKELRKSRCLITLLSHRTRCLKVTKFEVKTRTTSYSESSVPLKFTMKTNKKSSFASWSPNDSGSSFQIRACEPHLLEQPPQGPKFHKEANEGACPFRSRRHAMRFEYETHHVQIRRKIFGNPMADPKNGFGK